MTSASPQSAAPLTRDPYARHVVARLLDFFADTMPWPRRLWEISSVLALREATEAGDWLRLRVLSAGAVSWYPRALERQLGPDRGLGETRLRKELTTLLRSGLAPHSQDRRRLVQLLPMIMTGYLTRWASTRAVAADRLAAIVTCSWPRAELTALAHRHKPPTPDSVSTDLQGCHTNLERCEVIARALSAGTALSLVTSSDVAAAERIRMVLGAPYPQLADVRSIVQGVFRRLYRQRNIVVHGGNTAAIALDSALRTAAPLIGAGLDRLVHAQLIKRMEPLDLAARAENSLALAGDPLGPVPTRLLG